MHIFGICGPEAEAACDRLVEALDGRVAVVRNTGPDTAREEADGGLQQARPATEYDLGAEWRAYGESLSLGETFDRLAPDHDYAIAVGFPQANVPQVALGDEEVSNPLVSADSAAGLEIEAVLEAVADLEPHVTLESLVAEVKRAPDADQSGAIATFTGRVRAKDSPDDERTELLEFEKYEGVADRTMRTIESELEERDGVFEVAMHHRTGVIPDGEDIVFVVVLAGHREEAFRTVEDGINRLKDEVPIFKKEVTESETFWVHQRD